MLSVLFTGLIEAHLQRKTKCCRQLQPVHQVAMALQFYATGTFQSMVGNVLRVSQPSVCRAIHRVSKALCSISTTQIAYPDNLRIVSIYAQQLSNIVIWIYNHIIPAENRILWHCVAAWCCWMRGWNTFRDCASFCSWTGLRGPRRRPLPANTLSVSRPHFHIIPF